MHELLFSPPFLLVMRPNISSRDITLLLFSEVIEEPVVKDCEDDLEKVLSTTGNAYRQWTTSSGPSSGPMESSRRSESTGDDGINGATLR